MTRTTNRNYIKPIFRFISKPMMILPCLFRAILTTKRIWAKYLSCSNSIIYSNLSFTFFWIIFAIFLMGFLVDLLTPCTKPVFFIDTLTFFCMVISVGILSTFLSVLFISNTYASFTDMAIVIFAIFVFVKFGECSKLFAISTTFCYICFKHNQFLNNWLCLEPVAAHTASAHSILVERWRMSNKKRYYFISPRHLAGLLAKIYGRPIPLKSI